MDITLENLDQNVPIIIENIKNSLFLSFDFEFSGLNAHGAPKVNLHDTIQDRYFRAVNSAQNFLPIQFGLTTIAFNDNTYKTNTYNFYLFARKSTRKFLSESASIDFLVQNKFDFNKLFKSGINFMSKREEERINPKLIPSASGNQNQNQNQSPQQPLSQIVISKPEDVKFLDDSLNLIKQWLEEEEGVGELELPPCNTFFVRILYQEIPKKYPILFLKSSIAPFNKRIMKLSKVEVKQERSSFGSIINQIIESQKPLVGHNLILDLCHFYHSFLAPLPLSVEEFSQDLLKYFPKIIDTKYISENFTDKVEAPNTSLFDLYSFFSKSENFPSFPISSYEAELENPHEAGFDSYCAAFIFIKYCNLILNDNQINFHSPSLMQFHNKIFLPKSDVFLNLAFCRGSEINCKSSSVFYLYNFDPKVQTGTIGKWFSEFGSLKIEWKSDSSAFLIFEDESITKDLINSKYGNDSKFIIQTYAEYQQSLLSPSAEDNSKKRKFPYDNFEQNKRRRFENNNNNGNFNNIINNNNNKVATEDKTMKEAIGEVVSEINQDTKPKRPKKKNKKVVEEEENMLSSSLCTIS